MDKYAKPFTVKPVPTTLAKYFKVLTVSYYFTVVQVIVLGAIAVGLLIYFNAIEKGGFWGESVSQFMVVLFCSISVLYSIWISKFLFKKRLSKIGLDDSVLTKAKAYGKACAQRLAILSAPTIFSIVIFLLTGKILLIVLVMIMVVLLFYSRLTKERLINDLQLSSEETNIINDPDGVIG